MILGTTRDDEVNDDPEGLLDEDSLANTHFLVPARTSSSDLIILGRSRTSPGKAE